MPPKKQQKLTDLSVDDLQELIAQSVGEALKPLQSSVTKIQKELSSLRQQVDTMKEELVSKDAEIVQLKTVVKDGLDEREQYSRRKNLRIFGIEETDREDTDKLVIDLADKIGVSLQNSHIDRSHRVGKVGENPRPIIVRFVSYAERREVFTSKKKLRGTGIIVREDLTKLRLDLLKKAVSKYSPKAVWTSDGTILVNIGKTRPFRVKTESDLEKLFHKHPPSN
ncbi:Protein unc-13-like protein C [Frankliniella fusca]|uniref:Protein unc-13-like protein C n=1 Tax=Frankliniella fusca TaxID=407009 RepID=A0AAE1HHA4_9NEOP|nr:Protein unc-13-like protein C [Frankliniella fusca]